MSSYNHPTIQDIFRYACENNLIDMNNINRKQKKVIEDIIKCRTLDSGFNYDECPSCGYKKIHYNSCKNPNCPQCQAFNKEVWIQKEEFYSLCIKYFHVVFTIPEELNSYFLLNKKFSYNCLFKAVGETLNELAADSKYLGGQIGFTAVLHSWGANLSFHPHIHCIVSGGGKTTEGKWISKDTFLFPVNVLSSLFKGKFLDYFKSGYPKSNIDNIKEFNDTISFCYQKNWVVYTKEPLSNPDSVIKYLARYTHRIAISNSRIVSFKDGIVTFKYKDYKDNNAIKEMSLSAKEFCRRYLMHVPPKSFMRIRHYGFLGNSKKDKVITELRKITNTPEKPSFVRDTIKIITKIIGHDPRVCPRCNASLKRNIPFPLLE